MNSVSLIGRFAKEPELRFSASGTAICNFTLAVRNPFDKEGNADFIQCVAWGSGAELIAEKHTTGNMIGVDGRISTRHYENNDNQRVYVTEVNVNSIHLIQTKDAAEQQNSNTNNSSSNGNNRNTGNRNNSSNGNGNNRNNGSGNRNNRQNP